MSERRFYRLFAFDPDGPEDLDIVRAAHDGNLVEKFARLAELRDTVYVTRVGADEVGWDSMRVRPAS